MIFVVTCKVARLNIHNMPSYLVVIFFLTLIVIALFVLLLVISSKQQKLHDEKSALQEDNAALSADLKAKKEFIDELKIRRDEDSANLKEQYEKSLAQMKDAFKNLSNENSSTFRTQSSDALKDILKPLQDKFSEFDKAVRESERNSVERHSKLEQKIVDLDAKSTSVGNEAKNLANALTGYSKIQGDFGEMILTDILKNANLQEGVHFETQGVMTDDRGREIRSDEGRTMIPDVMIKYPDDTVVIVDSKVSLNAYNDYMGAETVEDRKKFAKALTDSVRRHVDELKVKDYASYLSDGKRKVNYNIMFIPIEGAFRLMLEADPRLWQVAKDNGVLIVSQMTLVIVLNMIQMSWKQYDQEENIDAVYKTASEFMSQLRSWLECYVRVGSAIDSARKSYDDSLKKLRDSNQSAVRKGESMLRQIQGLEKLGLSPKASKAKISTGSRMSGTGSIVPAGIEEEYEKE